MASAIPEVLDTVSSFLDEKHLLLIDGRWVPCRRPTVMAGGELTLEMLDLQFNEYSKFYEAPLHVKAMGGTFLIDDQGVLRREWRKVRVKGHAEEVLEAARSL